MKKKLLLGLLVLSLILGVSSVKADNYDYEIMYRINDITPNTYDSTSIRNYYNNYSSIIETAFQNFSSYYDTIKNNYPYYLSYINLDPTNTTGYVFYMSFWALSSPVTINFDGSTNSSVSAIHYTCSISSSINNTMSCSAYSGGTPTSFSPASIYIVSGSNRHVNANAYFFSNFYLYFNSNSVYDLAFTMYAPDLNDSYSTTGTAWLQESASPIKTLYDELELDFLEDYVEEEYTEVNLNNYDYVILSFKDYDHLISPSTLIVKGQACPSVVYNYGMTEKSNGVTDICSPNYQFFTNFNIYTTSNDLENHVVYYFKAYNTSLTNIIKVPTNIFDINYVSSANASNPTVIVGGRSYPAIPYDNLTSSATNNTENGYIPGETTNIFDLSSDSDFISNLFSNPLQTLGSVWTSIITMFALIGSFIGLLPITLQAFLYTGFSMAFILGIIKILL